MQNIGRQDLAEKQIKFDTFRSEHPAKERGSYELRSFAEFSHVDLSKMRMDAYNV